MSDFENSAEQNKHQKSDESTHQKDENDSLHQSDLEEGRNFSLPPATNSETDLIFENCQIVLADSSNIHERAINEELNWLLHIIYYRCTHPNEKINLEHLEGTYQGFKNALIEAPDLNNETHYHRWLKQEKLSDKLPERLFITLGLASYLAPPLLHPLNLLWEYSFVATWTGGSYNQFNRSFTPTMRSLFYLLDGPSQSAHNRHILHFGAAHALIQNNIILLSSKQPNTPLVNQQVQIKEAYALYFLGGEMPRPEDNQDLPIEKLETSMNYEELVLKPETRHELKELVAIAQVGKEYFADSSSSSGFRKGFIALLHGEPGTGKTLIATTIGKYTNRVTYQLKMSEVVSKYIGETSQNINKVFDELQRTIEWLQGEPSILFIDEADAILGKRSEVTDSKDRYANLDVSNLLQRVEKFPGLIILATNFQQNIDPAFHRRINVQIHVPPPDADERFELWKRYLPAKYSFPTDNFARVMANKFALTGAQINNVMKRATVMAHANEATVLDFEEYLEQPLKSELMKAGKVYTRPKDLMSLAQIDEQIYQQELLWDKALPTRWQYIPTFLPQVLSQAVTLSEEDIKDVVKKVKRRWEGGAYNHLPWNEGIEVVLRDLCAVRNLDWNSIQAKVYELLDENKKEKAATEDIDLNNEQERAGKTIQLVDMSKLKNAAENRQEADDQKEKEAKAQKEKEQEAEAKLSKKERLLKLENPPQSLGKVMGKKEAEAYWKEIIPEEYTYATKSTPKNLADFYGLSKEAIQWIMKTAIENADAEGATELTGGGFINPAITEMEKTLGMDSLMRREHLERERKRKEAFERKKKVVPSWKDAPVYWAEAPPKDYRYARGDTASYLGQFLPGFSFGQMLTVIAKAAEYAQKDGTNLIAYTPHILPALEELGIQPPTL